MDIEYENALKEIKEANILKNEILKNITQVKLPTGFSITFEKEWIYPDGHVFKSQRFGKRICLRQDGIAIGLLNFTISPGNIIDIYSIQGIKNSRKEHPKNWAKLLTDTFITACMPRLIKDNNYKLHYQGKTELDGEKEYYNRLVEGLKNPKTSKDKKQENTEIITILENKKKFIKIILGTYFDKEGYIYFNKDGKLNTNRLRTKELSTKFITAIKREYIKPKQSLFKRRPLKRINQLKRRI